MVISQPSWSFFDVGFHQIDCVGKCGMALPAFSDFLPHESTPFPGGKPSMPNFFPKPVKKSPVSIYEPCFHHGGLGGDVRVGHMDHISPCAHTVPKCVAHVPQQIERFPYYPVWRGFLTEEHQ